jgi:5'-methylthioadenosine phosphorylase
VTAAPRAELGVFGGSGLYALLDDGDDVEIDTPYGPTSAPLRGGEVGGRRVAFLPRHGVGHEHPPHRVPYRANVWALHALGVRQVVAPCAVGSLRADLGPTTFVIPDQLVDRTSGRDGTFFDGPTTFHAALADPYCDHLRAEALAACRAEGVAVEDGGTVTVVGGPRFSTRAESRWFASMGTDLLNMTQAPEAALCREAGLCYAAIALVTDYDVGLDGTDLPPVTQAEVFALFDATIPVLRRILLRLLSDAGQPCGLEAGPGF